MTAPLDPTLQPPPKTGALALTTYQLTKRFGAFTALDHVDIEVRPGTVHALLGENGAGKSTLVNAIVGYHLPDEGAVLIDGREHAITSPVVARELGIGMAYQHFTVTPGMPATPFQLGLDARRVDLSAGEKQKLEILRQLYLQPRLLILDEPTSVLTPQEADEVLGALRDRAHAGDVSVIMISHKFREVMEVADDVSVLRRGKLMGSHRVADTTPRLLGAEMMGQAESANSGAAMGTIGQELERTAQPLDAAERLRIEALSVDGDRGERAVRDFTLSVKAGEIVGVAGVSGNGQRELMEALVGQRDRAGGQVFVAGEAYRATRAQNQRLNVRSLPEEPLRNASVGDLSVAMNIGLRRFDQAPAARGGWLRGGVLRQQARELIATYGIKTQGENAPIRSLSGGNVQRAVLARELDGQVDVLLVANPVFGLDFAAVAEIHSRIMAVRNAGGAVLLISEDLDELLKLADRIVVMSEGQVVHGCDARDADRHVLGSFMGGHHHGPHDHGAHQEAA